MDEASPFRVLMPAVSLTARTSREIGPPHPPDPIMGGPKCRTGTSILALRTTASRTPLDNRQRVFSLCPPERGPHLELTAADYFRNFAGERPGWKRQPPSSTRT